METRTTGRLKTAKPFSDGLFIRNLCQIRPPLFPSGVPPQVRAPHFQGRVCRLSDARSPAISSKRPSEKHKPRARLHTTHPTPHNNPAQAAPPQSGARASRLSGRCRYGLQTPIRRQQNSLSCARAGEGCEGGRFAKPLSRRKPSRNGGLPYPGHPLQAEEEIKAV
ncbi:hypothetical protein [Kingella potus]|uniref:hypothetical protein n=1 Tax=Kingella potus TaxID=265175 RepID=UPI0011C074BC|nr:hypothetical protein [Kingella potus]UOP01701.1 hypothetical protein LVJ84_06135 [Kingella potus]